MIKLSTLRDLVLVVASLLFLPQESRMLLFELKPEDWYGELRLQTSEEVYILSKNAGEESVILVGKSPSLHVAKHLDSEISHDLRNANEIPPESVSLIKLNSAAVSPGRLVKTEAGRFFQPSSLLLSTRADGYLAFILIVILVAVFVALGFSCSVLIGERRSLIVDRE